MDRLLETEADRRSFIKWCERWLKLPSTVTIHSGRQRTIDQNRLLWMWAGEAAQQRPGTTAREVQNEWKRMYGIPLLCAESEEFAATWLRVEMKHNYEQQLELMPIIAVSSIMSVTQFKTFLDEIWRASTEHGILLTDPEEQRSGTTRAAPGRVDRSDAASSPVARRPQADRTAPGRKVR